ncbi:hypothetical protein TRIUR3_34756 [Triticum urartu]|nr:hypothetical protein TRIUR3_34756 [Triticum urartu]
MAVALVVMVMMSSLLPSCHAKKGKWKCKELEDCTAPEWHNQCKERGYNQGGHSFSSICSGNKTKCCCRKWTTAPPPP